MKVDFNNLRINAAHAYNDLVALLNRERTGRGLVKVNEEDLQKPLDDLRQIIGLIMCVYDNENQVCRSVIDEVEMLTFAPDEKEI